VGSGFAGINDPTAIGHILYAENIPIVPGNETWILARRSPIHSTIVPTGDIHIFIG
jgi:hypothetical protein